MSDSSASYGGPMTDTPPKLNFNGTFTENIQPFRINVDETFLTNTKTKLSLTRFVDDIQQPDFADGPPKHIVMKIAKYWAEEYDWRQVEAKINNKFRQFTTLVKIPAGSSTASMPLHFVHHRSQRIDAIPLLFIHGWPGSFLEIEHLIEPLTNPEDNSLPAFHLVAPSIPGYGFSPSPRRPGFGYRQAGATFHALMQKLGYPKFVFQGGDAGDFIGRLMAVDFPHAVVSGHSNFWIVPPTEDDAKRAAAGLASDDEHYAMKRLGDFVNEHWSYGQIHQTRPLKLAIGLTDSPIGLAMWIYDICLTVVEDAEVFNPERLVTWTMMHWIPGPYGAFSLYKNGRKDGVISSQGIELLPYVSQPIAVSQFPYDIGYRIPLEWARRGGNIKVLTRHDRGGHFAAIDAPDLLVDDIRGFFGDHIVSGTNIFRN